MNENTTTETIGDGTAPDNVDINDGDIVLKFSLNNESTGEFKVETFTKCDFPYLMLMTAGLLSMAFSEDLEEVQKLLDRGNEFIMGLQANAGGSETVQ